MAIGVTTRCAEFPVAPMGCQVAGDGGVVGLADQPDLIIDAALEPLAFKRLGRNSLRPS